MAVLPRAEGDRPRLSPLTIVAASRCVGSDHADSTRLEIFLFAWYILFALFFSFSASLPTVALGRASAVQLNLPDRDRARLSSGHGERTARYGFVPIRKTFISTVPRS